MSKQSKPNQTDTRKASYTTTQQPNQQPSKPSPNAFITYPTCKQPFPAKYRTCTGCPRQVPPLNKISTLRRVLFLLGQCLPS